jgi:hypothetical protein
MRLGEGRLTAPTADGQRAAASQSAPLARSGMTAVVLRPNFIAVCLDETEDRAQQPRNLGNVG